MRFLPALLLLAGLANAGHEIVELQCPPKIAHRVVRDLDGDGLDDVMVVTAEEAWLWRGRRGRMPTRPDARLRLPEGTALFDVGPAGKLVARTSKAYFAVRAGKDPERLAQASGAGLPAKPTNLLWRGLFRDFDGDGQGDFLDVSLAGFTIAYGGGGSVRLPAPLNETVETRAAEASDRLVARYAIGEWTHGDFDATPGPDFAVLTPTGLLVYTGDAKGRFDPARSIEITIAEAKDADLTFLDLNRDGKVDVVARRRKVGRVSILVADAARGLEAPHRIRLAIPGHLRRKVVIADLDGDARPDIALPYTGSPSVMTGVRAIVRGEAILKVPVFLNRGGKQCIGGRADTQFTFPVRLRVTTDAAGRIKLGGLVVVEYEGDLDGDGRNDLLVTTSSTELGLHRGVRRGVFEREASSRLPIPDCAGFDTVRSAAANLNGDGQSDIMLHYAGADRRPDRLYLLASRKD